MKIFIDIILIIIAACLQMYFVNKAISSKTFEGSIVSWIFVVLLIIFIVLMGGVIGVHVWQT